MSLGRAQSVLPEVHYFTLAAMCLQASHSISLSFLGLAGKGRSK